MYCVETNQGHNLELDFEAQVLAFRAIQRAYGDTHPLLQPEGEIRGRGTSLYEGLYSSDDVVVYSGEARDIIIESLEEMAADFVETDQVSRRVAGYMVQMAAGMETPLASIGETNTAAPPQLMLAPPIELEQEVREVGEQAGPLIVLRGYNELNTAQALIAQQFSDCHPLIRPAEDVPTRREPTLADALEETCEQDTTQFTWVFRGIDAYVIQQALQNAAQSKDDTYHGANAKRILEEQEIVLEAIQEELKAVS